MMDGQTNKTGFTHREYLTAWQQKQAIYNSEERQTCHQMLPTKLDMRLVERRQIWAASHRTTPIDAVRSMIYKPTYGEKDN